MEIVNVMYPESMLTSKPFIWWTILTILIIVITFCLAIKELKGEKKK